MVQYPAQMPCKRGIFLVSSCQHSFCLIWARQPTLFKHFIITIMKSTLLLTTFYTLVMSLFPLYVMISASSQRPTKNSMHCKACFSSEMHCELWLYLVTFYLSKLNLINLYSLLMDIMCRLVASKVFLTKSVSYIYIFPFLPRIKRADLYHSYVCMVNR